MAIDSAAMASAKAMIRRMGTMATSRLRYPSKILGVIPIPGRAEGAIPESITTTGVMDSGTRFARPE
jgi:hypothetical protein